MRGGLICIVVCALAVSACGDATPSAVVRSADDVQVMTPAQVAKARSEMAPLTTTPASLAPGDTVAPGQPGDSVPAGDTVPQNVDNRPPELKLFDAYAKLKSCIEDAGYTIQGNLQDPKNPAYKDPEYVKVVTTCAARSDILEILKEMQSTRADLSPAEVETRNKAFKQLETCLKGRGWTIETTTDKIGLINPSVFQSPDGSLNTRDINQCLSETGINDAIKGNG
ncbi:unannotated protein [freshwater metagenome]|uniref:Unannotated protein n=1 Tax=freshwater metagenome TaxID=449393 RepID=A0A6J7E487_9ZZZZ|nr:hypothetical protein [Actinomycetota bacterium]